MPHLNPEQVAQTSEHKKGRRGLFIGIGAGATGLAAGAALVFGLGAGPKENNEPPITGPTPTEVAEPSPDTPETPASDEFSLELEELSKMTPEQITELATISVEEVTVDGKIDWGKYVSEIYRVMKLQANAGSTAAELEDVYISGGDPVDTAALKYNDAFEAGYGLPGFDLDGVIDMQYNIIRASDILYLWEDKSGVVRANYQSVSFSVLNETADSVTIDSRVLVTDNLFSSGALKATDAKPIEELGRSIDQSVEVINSFVLKIVDGKILIESAFPKDI